MNVHDSPKVLEFFRRVLQMRGWIVCLFVLLTIAGIYGATRIPSDPAIDRLVVAGDATAQATIEFDRLFPEGEQALIMLGGAGPALASSAAYRRSTPAPDRENQRGESTHPPGLLPTHGPPKRRSATARLNACGHLQPAHRCLTCRASR